MIQLTIFQYSVSFITLKLYFKATIVISYVMYIQHILQECDKL